MNRYQLLDQKLGIVLDVNQPDLGHPEIPGLWQQLRAAPVRRGRLQCLWCLTERGATEWVHLVERSGTRFPRHFDARIREHPDVSDTHRALVARVARDATSYDSAISFTAEAPSGDGTWVADGLVTAPGRPGVVFEAQLAPMGPDTARRRDEARRASGLHRVWTPRNDGVPWARGIVPTAVIPRPDAAYLTAGEPTPVVAGVSIVEEQRCHSSRDCPWRRNGGCGRTHLQLVMPGEVTGAVGWNENLRRPELGHLVAGLALGEWETVTDRRGHYRYVRAEDARRWLAETGGTVAAPDEERQRSSDVRHVGTHRWSPPQTGLARPLAAVDQRPVVAPGAKAPEPLRPSPAGTCGHPDCDGVARFYPAGWRCADHEPSRTKPVWPLPGANEEAP